METKPKKEPKTEPKPKKRKGTSCIGCQKRKHIGGSAYACTSKTPDMLNFTCYE